MSLQVRQLLELSGTVVACEAADVIVDLCDMSCEPVSERERFFTLGALMLAQLFVDSDGVLLEVTWPAEDVLALIAGVTLWYS